ncbi:hypothetical protein ADL27_48390 [Streptomyces sp. NRRL F-6602]|uniref:hypothetical protein n=1 Tax=Streptomyces albus TaxID=1888 RepID=UPI0006B68F4A|nr:hypothetical protein ADL27_48390 [Streptomyces sp. NRRL F-6602]
MGNRKKRRQRQQLNAKKKQRNARKRSVQRFFFPSTAEQLLEVHFTADLTAGERDAFLKYWQFSEPGSWTYKVADLEGGAQISRRVREVCHASLPTVTCPQCETPLTVANRSELAQKGVWNPEDFPRSATKASTPCQACREVAARNRRQAEREAAEQAQRDLQERIENASSWVADHENAPEPELPEDPAELLTLLTLVELLETKGGTSIGPLNKLDYTFGVSGDADIVVFKRLYAQRWIVPTLPATVNNFTFNPDNTVRGVYVDQVPWRLSHALGENAPHDDPALGTHLALALLDRSDDLAGIATELDVATAVRYLDSLLVKKYQEAHIPEHRLPDAHEVFRQGLGEGFTFGQLLAMAWGSAASAVAWGQRTPGLREGSVSSAAVTSMERRLGFARDRPVPEYELPYWVTPPACRATALRFLDHREAELRCLGTFQSLRQSIAERAANDWHTESSHATAPDAPAPVTHGTDLADVLGDQGTAVPAPRAITYALVRVDGSLEFRKEPETTMKETVGLDRAGTGLVDRVIIEGPTRIHAYVVEYPVTTVDDFNIIGLEMLTLLEHRPDVGPYGPVAFFSIGNTFVPQSLDEEQQRLIATAHSIAWKRVAPPSPNPTNTPGKKRGASSEQAGPKQ